MIRKNTRWTIRATDTRVNAMPYSTEVASKDTCRDLSNSQEPSDYDRIVTSLDLAVNSISS